MESIAAGRLTRGLLSLSAVGAVVASSAAVTRTPEPSTPFWVETMMASSPISWRTSRIASAMLSALKVLSRIAGRPYTWPSVRMRALGWISFCDMTVVIGRNRSTMDRT